MVRVLKAIVWMLLIAGILITCPDLVMQGRLDFPDVFMLMLALEKGWYQVAVTKVMTGIGISVVGCSSWHTGIFFSSLVRNIRKAVSWRCLQ